MLDVVTTGGGVATLTSNGAQAVPLAALQFAPSYARICRLSADAVPTTNDSSLSEAAGTVITVCAASCMPLNSKWPSPEAPDGCQNSYSVIGKPSGSLTENRVDPAST